MSHSNELCDPVVEVENENDGLVYVQDVKSNERSMCGLVTAIKQLICEFSSQFCEQYLYVLCFNNDSN